MITNDNSNTNPAPLNGYLYQAVFGVGGIAQDTPSAVISSLSPCADSCSCDSCSYENKVFAELAFTSDLKNDKRKFFGIALNDSGVVKFFLQKCGNDILEITDSSFGELINAGGYSENLKLATLYLEFDKVLQSYGEGVYTVRVETEALSGPNVSEISQQYHLQIYANNRAEGSVRFTWIQNGLILDNAIDFTGLEMEQQVRLRGNIGFNNEPQLVIDEHETSSHVFEQIQDQVLFNYPFESEPISFHNSLELLKDVILGDSIKVTSYNFYNHWILTETEVKAIEILDARSLPYNKCAIIKINFAEKQRNTIKRNYF